MPKEKTLILNRAAFLEFAKDSQATLARLSIGSRAATASSAVDALAVDNDETLLTNSGDWQSEQATHKNATTWPPNSGRVCQVDCTRQYSP